MNVLTRRTQGHKLTTNRPQICRQRIQQDTCHSDQNIIGPHLQSGKGVIGLTAARRTCNWLGNVSHKRKRRRRRRRQWCHLGVSKPLDNPGVSLFFLPLPCCPDDNCCQPVCHVCVSVSHRAGRPVTLQFATRQLPSTGQNVESSCFSSPSAKIFSSEIFTCDFLSFFRLWKPSELLGST